ncbi:MAG: monovalent cation/H(+) antiporter subunit G [Pseudomonadota bacterium]|mgnify:CR=1 FL=1
MTDVIAGVLVLLGGIFAVIASLGVIRLPDVLIRMHASTKVGTLSCGLIIAGVAVEYGDAAVVLRGIAIIVFLLLTAPIAGHMIGRAALRTGVKLWSPKAADGSGE